MKKIVLTFGLISGAISAVLMSAIVPFIYKIGFDWGTIVGYTAIVLSFLLVFFGIRSYRENVGGGYITFGRGFKVGILIVLISSICYVLTWEFVYRQWLPDFPDKYGSYVLEKARAKGASPAELAEQEKEINNMKWILQSPLLSAGVAFLEPMPVGLVMTLISAAILRRRRKEELDGPKQLEHSAA